MDLAERSAHNRTRHPWERSRAQHLLRVLRTHNVLHDGAAIVDVGAGDGYVAECIHAAYPTAHVTVWDTAFTDDDMQQARARGWDARREKPDALFDVAMLLDVAEHVDDDDALLRSAVALLKPGGALLFTVPCWQALWSAHDEALHHKRRYSHAQARALLQSAGVDVVVGGGMFHTLLFARAVQIFSERAMARAQPQGVGHWTRGPLVTGALTALLGSELAVSRLAASRHMPVPGLSYWALCKKPGGIA